MLYDLKNVDNLLFLTTSYNWSRVGHPTWFDNYKNALKCHCFLTRREILLAQVVLVKVMPGYQEVLSTGNWNDQKNWDCQQVLSTCDWEDREDWDCLRAMSAYGWKDPYLLVH